MLTLLIVWFCVCLPYLWAQWSFSPANSFCLCQSLLTSSPCPPHPIHTKKLWENLTQKAQYRWLKKNESAVYEEQQRHDDTSDLSGKGHYRTGTGGQFPFFISPSGWCHPALLWQSFDCNWTPSQSMLMLWSLLAITYRLIWSNAMRNNTKLLIYSQNLQLCNLTPKVYVKVYKVCGNCVVFPLVCVLYLWHWWCVFCILGRVFGI